MYPAESRKPARSGSDQTIVELIRSQGPLGVSQLASSTKVTATAIRQRLGRLMAQGIIERETQSAATGRGRPSHRYKLSAKGERAPGDNFTDLAVVLWSEIKEIKDTEIKRGLMKRLALRMAAIYRDRMSGDTVEQRMSSVADILRERNVPMTVDTSGALPVLTALACPYPDLAEHDPGICAVEKMMFSELIGTNVALTECRLDGGRACRFQTN